MNAKNDTSEYADLQVLIPDYLNDAVTYEQREAIEKAMQRNSAFRKMVESDRALLSTIRNQAPTTNARPSFSDISGKVHRRSKWMSPGVAWPSAAAFALVLMIGMGAWTGNQVGFNDFETLSAEPVSYENSTLRVIGASGVSADELRSALMSYELTIENEYPSLGVYDVSKRDMSELEAVAGKLRKDRRIRSVRLLTETNP